MPAWNNQSRPISSYLGGFWIWNQTVVPESHTNVIKLLNHEHSNEHWFGVGMNLLCSIVIIVWCNDYLAEPCTFNYLKYNLNFFRVSLTTDGWSSINRDPYMSLTAHFINSDWVLTTRCLKTQYYPDSHTAENVSQFIQDGLHEYGLRFGNVASISTDNAANMIAAIRLTSMFQFQMMEKLHQISTLSLFGICSSISITIIIYPLHCYVHVASIMMALF